MCVIKRFKRGSVFISNPFLLRNPTSVLQKWVWNGYGYFLTNQPDQPKPANSENFQLLCFLSDLDEIWYGANIGQKTTQNEFEMATVIFWPTKTYPPKPTNQNRPIAKNFNFCVFHAIWMKFGMGANIGQKTT